MVVELEAFKKIGGLSYDCGDLHPLFGISPGDGSVWPEEGRLLCAFAHRYGGPVLEIGAQRGVSTRYILFGLPKADKLYSVDLYHQYAPAAGGHTNLVQVTGSSFTYEPPPCSWAFIDGDHSYDGVLSDIATARKAGCTMLFFHDGAPHLQGLLHDGYPLGVRRAIMSWHSANAEEWHLAELVTKSGMFYARHKFKSPNDAP